MTSAADGKYLFLYILQIVLQAGETNIQQHLTSTTNTSNGHAVVAAATNGHHKTKTASSYEQERFEQINSKYVEETHTERQVRRLGMGGTRPTSISFGNKTRIITTYLLYYRFARPIKRPTEPINSIRLIWRSSPCPAPVET